MPKSRNKRKNGKRKLSGYVIQTTSAIKSEERQSLENALRGINERTPKTKQLTANALRIREIYKNSHNIIKKLRKKVHIVQHTQ